MSDGLGSIQDKGVPCLLSLLTDLPFGESHFKGGMTESECLCLLYGSSRSSPLPMLREPARWTWMRGGTFTEVISHKEGSRPHSFSLGPTDVDCT